jgi:hypothetical protein
MGENIVRPLESISFINYRQKLRTKHKKEPKALKKLKIVGKGEGAMSFLGQLCMVVFLFLSQVKPEGSSDMETTVECTVLKRSDFYSE